MSDALTLREKGIELNHILSGLMDAETCLEEVTSQGRQPNQNDLDRIARCLGPIREAVNSLRTDYVNNPDGWGA